jgi:hypothetical protein
MPITPTRTQDPRPHRTPSTRSNPQTPSREVVYRHILTPPPPNPSQIPLHVPMPPGPVGVWGAFVRIPTYYELGDALFDAFSGKIERRNAVNNLAEELMRDLAGEPPSDARSGSWCPVMHHLPGGIRFVTGRASHRTTNLGYYAKAVSEPATLTYHLTDHNLSPLQCFCWAPGAGRRRGKKTFCHFRKLTAPLSELQIRSHPLLYNLLHLRHELRPTTRITLGQERAPTVTSLNESTPAFPATQGPHSPSHSDSSPRARTIVASSETPSPTVTGSPTSSQLTTHINQNASPPSPTPGARFESASDSDGSLIEFRPTQVSAARVKRGRESDGDLADNGEGATKVIDLTSDGEGCANVIDLTNNADSPPAAKRRKIVKAPSHNAPVIIYMVSSPWI